MIMKRMVVSILGEDRPGIIYAVSRVLSDLSCNILEVSQTILKTEFAGIFLAAMPGELTEDRLQDRLHDALGPLGVTVTVKEFKERAAPLAEQAEPYVITLRGGDRMGIIPEISGVISGFDVNVENLKAIAQANDSTNVVIVFEVAVPASVHMPAFREALRWKAEELELELGLQHREIFEAIYRI